MAKDFLTASKMQSTQPFVIRYLAEKSASSVKKDFTFLLIV